MKVRQAKDELVDLEAWARVRSTVMPREPLTADEVRRGMRRPERTYLLGELDGEIVGAALGTARSDFAERGFVQVLVLPDARRRGLGSELYEAAGERARSLDPRSIGAHVSQNDPDSIAFAERRGFREIDRQFELALDLHGKQSQPELPAGIDIVTIGEELEETTYAVAAECYPDLATSEQMKTPSFEEWKEEELRGPIAFAAREGERVVGYAALIAHPGLPELLEHGLTGVARSHRRRGIATALKRTQIAWASRHGYRELTTWTQEANDGMKAINLALGYRPLPAVLNMRLLLR